MKKVFGLKFQLFTGIIRTFKPPKTVLGQTYNFLILSTSITTELRNIYKAMYGINSSNMDHENHTGYILKCLGILLNCPWTIQTLLEYILRKYTDPSFSFGLVLVVPWFRVGCTYFEGLIIMLVFVFTSLEVLLRREGR